MAWVEKRTSGKWQGNYRLANGQKRSAGTFTHKAEALRAANELEIRALKSSWLDPSQSKIKWAEWEQVWSKSRPIHPSTLVIEKGMIQRHILPYWGNTPLGEITRHQINAWIAQLTRTQTTKNDGSTLSGASIRRITGIFKSSLTGAIEAGLIMNNPAIGTKQPTVTQGIKRYLTKEEFWAIEETLTKNYDPIHAQIARMLVGTGIRWGELVPLRELRLNRERQTLTIAESFDTKSRKTTPYPKGKHQREVPVPDWATPERKTNRNEYLFLTNGTLLDGSNWRHNVWYPALKETGIGHARIHDLRHTYASWLLQAGIGLPELSRLLGHASIQTTMIYAHLAELNPSTILHALLFETGGKRGARIHHLNTPKLRSVYNFVH